MKISDLLWLAVFGAIAAALASVDYASHRGRLLGVWLLAGGWALVGLLLTLGWISLGSGVSTVVLLSGSAVLGTLFSLGRERLLAVRVRR